MKLGTKLVIASVTLSAMTTNIFAESTTPTQQTQLKTAKKHALKTTNKVIVKRYPSGLVLKREGNHVTIILPPGVPLPKTTHPASPSHDLAVTGRGAATASINAPNAFGPSKPTIFASAVYVNHWPTTTAQDGTGGVGFSVGDPNKFLGILVNVGTADFGFNRASFGQNGGVSIRLNHYIDPTTAVAWGISNIGGWNAYRTTAHGYYGAITKSFYCLRPITLNAGLGTGGLYSLNDGVTNNDNNVGPFASMGVGLYKNLSAIVDYTTRQVNVGGNYVFTFIPKVPIFLGLYAANVNKFEGTTHFQAAGGLSYTFN